MKKSLYFSHFLFSFFLFAQTINAQTSDEPALTESVESITVIIAEQDDQSRLIGEQIPLVFSLHNAQDSQFVSVRISNNSFVEIISFEREKTELSDSLNIIFAAFRPGTHQVELTINFIDSNGAPLEISSPSFQLPIQATLEPEDNMLVPPGDFVPVYTRNTQAMIGLSLLIVGFLLGFLVLFWWRHRRANQPIVEELPPQRPADEVALESLNTLENSDWLESGKHIEFHLRLSEILREFIGRSFSFHAPEMTTQEIMHAMAQIPDETKSFTESIRAKLYEMDMVKFAKANLPLSESKNLLLSTRTLVLAVTEQIREREAQKALELAMKKDEQAENDEHSSKNEVFK